MREPLWCLRWRLTLSLYLGWQTYWGLSEHWRWRGSRMAAESFTAAMRELRRPR